MAEGITVMNELIIPCIHLIVNNDISKEDLDAIETMRKHWCSYLGQDVAGVLFSALLGPLRLWGSQRSQGSHSGSPVAKPREGLPGTPKM